MRKPYKRVKKLSEERRMRRRLSARKKISGTLERPRICVTKSNQNLFVQVINDVDSSTLLTVQTFGKNAVKGASNNKEGAVLLGKVLAEKLKEKNITRAVFDRAGYPYHGVVAALVESAREKGVSI